MANLYPTLTLRRRWKEGLAAADLVAKATSLAGPRRLIGFVYAPAETSWVTADGLGGLRPPKDAPLPRGVFEIRLFDGLREWRWRDLEGQGHGACVAEDDSPLPKGWSAEELSVTAVDRAYLLWGTSLGAAGPGWSTLATPRTGPFQVPVEVEPRRSAALHTRLYVGRLDQEHGNAGIVEERLVELKVASHAAGTEGP